MVISNKIVSCIMIIGCLFNKASDAAENFTPNSQPAGFLQPMAMSTNDLVNGAKGYRPWFENGAWQGDLIEYDISSIGQISTTIKLTIPPTNSDVTSGNWSARLQFEAAEANETATARYWDVTRKIITSVNGVQVAFRWSNLTDAQKEQLDRVTFSTNADADSSNILNFVRGDRSDEKPSGTMRRRYSLLGDIMHSNPVYVGKPDSNISDTSYISFQNAQINRAPRVYVGANDGMLHVFNAITGNEVYAFIPPSVIGKLDNLAADPYGHEYYVDGELAVYDVKIGSNWRTILIGGLGAGGSERFALDITNPDLTSETANTGNDNKVLWLTDNQTNTLLGDAYGQATLVKLEDGHFYSVVGNGYNSAGGTADLILTNLATGLITSIPTGSGSATAPNGLSTPVLIDLNENGAYDVAYAGDLDGNLWKFDLTARTLAITTPLFSAGADRPITTKPTVTRHPNGGKLVFFGTGKILAPSDLNDRSNQAMYGIWDKNVEVLASSLLVQTLSDDQVVEQKTIKTLSNHAIDWTSHLGWVVELDDGFKIVTNHKLQAGRLQMTIAEMLDPDDKSQEHPQNWLFEPSYLNGGAPAHTLFDLNSDGILDVDDHVGKSIDPDKIPVAWNVSSGISSGPVIAKIANGVDAKFLNIEILQVAQKCLSGCGFTGGHIDVDTDAPNSPGNGYAGSTTAHTHEYDKIVEQPYVDYFELNQASTAQLQVDEVIARTKKFFVVIANADLSSKSTLHIGNTTYNIVEYQRMIQNKLERWDGQLDTLVDDQGNSLIVSINDIQTDGGTLRNAFDSHSILDGGLHPTQTSCVKKSLEITNNRWRNGALVLQLIDPTVINNLTKLYQQRPSDMQNSLIIDSTEVFLKEDFNNDLIIDVDIDGDTEVDTYGGLRGEVAGNNGVLYESSLFWHYGKIAELNGFPKVCYGQTGWAESVAAERKGITQAQFNVFLAEAGYTSIDEVKAKLATLKLICANSSNVGSCLKQDYEGKELKKVIKGLELLLTLHASIDLGNSDSDPGSTPGTTPVISGEPLAVTGGNISTGVTAGPNYVEGRRTWVDLTVQ